MVKIKQPNRCNKVKILCSYYYNKVKGYNKVTEQM